MIISQTSQKYDITADTLRYHERIGLIPPVNRNASGIRDYTEDDCNWVHFIKCMRSAGLSIEISFIRPQ
ncbi:MerR family transcriptional regulator [Clostridium estertheticum]|nr:MerR family transcriptional regulator [Clostridium estertheticum]WLC88217.1 MerR family transcriptional regulator [Clostridium estertheticum]